MKTIRNPSLDIYTIIGHPHQLLAFISAKGSARRESAGLISYLAQQASALHPESQQPPVISMEYDIGYVEVHPLGCI